MPQFDEITLTKVLVGGVPVGYTKSTGLLHLAGEDVTYEQWKEISRRINLFFERDGHREKAKTSDPNAGTSSFLTRNLREILKRDIGIIKDPPWYLKGRFSGVIGKESLWEQ